MAGVTAPLLGLQKRSLREQALAALRTAITSGELEPGRHLVETELSDMLQISRGTLREALRQLEQEGLLAAGPLIARLGYSASTLVYASLGLAAVLAIGLRWRHALWRASAPANAMP